MGKGRLRSERARGVGRDVQQGSSGKGAYQFSTQKRKERRSPRINKNHPGNGAYPLTPDTAQKNEKRTKVNADISQEE